jgi:Activator of Hsp90 ATPase homolog 1-like protein
MTSPLKISFEVACPAAHAFEVWTLQIGTWWPSDHTVTGHPDHVVLQAGVGGRIFERTADGVEHDWGQVTRWDPPKQLTYLWHLGADPSSATEVEIQFLPLDEGSTRVEIEHRGWEELGDAAAQWRDRNHAGWATLLPHFEAAIARGDQ